MPYEQFEIKEVGPRVWAAVARPGAGATSNAGIIDMGRTTLVYDTSLTPQGAKELRLAARLLTNRDPTYVVNSHWHLDHTLGNRVLGGSTIMATERTRELLEERGPPATAEIGNPGWALRTMDLQTQAASEQRPAYLEELQCEIAARRDLAAAKEFTEIRLPDQIFRDRHRFDGDRGVVVIEGAGHCESDSVVWVHDAEVLFTGDLVTIHCYPDLESAEIDRWSNALLRLEAAKPRVVVPGHGPVGGVEALPGLRGYFQWLRRRGVTFGSEMPAPPGIGDWRRPSNGQRNLKLWGSYGNG